MSIGKDCCRVMGGCKPCGCEPVGLSDVLPVWEDNERVEVRPVAVLPGCEMCVPCNDGRAVE